MKKIRQLICRHEYEVVKKVTTFQSLRGDQLYKRCKKCEKVIPYIYLEHEGNGYK